jgi:hypothetical protein
MSEFGTFDGLKFLIQYRRKDDGVRWHNMAAFDGELAAKRFFGQQDTDESCPWEYSLYDIEENCRTSQVTSPQSES